MRWFHALATHVFEKAYGTNALEHLKTALMSDQLEAKELEQLQLICKVRRSLAQNSMGEVTDSTVRECDQAGVRSDPMRSKT